METTIFNSQGKKKGSLTLPEQIFGLPWNESLIHQVVTTMQGNARPSVAHTKGRGDVRGGGKKPWRQKGTGRARHGSIRSPIWRGGGVTHGPSNEKQFGGDLPKKMRMKALFVALSRKFKDGELILVDSFGLSKPQTSAAKKVLALIAQNKGFEKLSKKKNAALIAVSAPDEAIKKSFRNMGNVSVVGTRDLNPVAVLGNSYLILENPEASIAILAERASKKK